MCIAKINERMKKFTNSSSFAEEWTFYKKKYVSFEKFNITSISGKLKNYAW